MSIEEDLNERLYDKITAEQDEFRKSLLAMTPEEVLDRAYEYCIREDIIASLESYDVPVNQAKALLRQKKPLEMIVRKWKSTETNHMETISDVIEETANDIILETAIRNRGSGR